MSPSFSASQLLSLSLSISLPFYSSIPPPIQLAIHKLAYKCTENANDAIHQGCASSTSQKPQNPDCFTLSATPSRPLLTSFAKQLLPISWLSCNKGHRSVASLLLAAMPFVPSSAVVRLTLVAGCKVRKALLQAGNRAVWPSSLCTSRAYTIQMIETSKLHVVLHKHKDLWGAHLWHPICTRRRWTCHK